MSTIREQILDAVVEALEGTSGVSTRIYRSRTLAFANSNTPSIIVEPVSDSADQSTIARIDWTLGIRITVYVRGDIPDQIADPTVEDIHSKLMTDPVIQNLIVDIQPVGTSWQILEADRDAAVITNDFRVSYKTSLTDLATQD